LRERSGENRQYQAIQSSVFSGSLIGWTVTLLCPWN
jgi:hypothetical protein